MVEAVGELVPDAGNSVRALFVLLVCLTASAADLRVGVIGTDTSHATAFSQVLNDPNSPDHVAGARITGAYKGGSADLKHSAERVDKFAEEMRTKWGVKFYDDIPSLCKDVDAILLLSVDGRVHLAQFKQVLAARKPVFLDKPLASSLADAKEIGKLAKDAGVPWFSASSLRYGDVATKMAVPAGAGVTTFGPGPLEPLFPIQLSYYGIHAVELLYSLMGPGCEEVTRMTTPAEDAMTCRWSDGRIGVARLLRPGNGKYGAAVLGPKGMIQSQPDWKEGYAPLLVKIIEFFQTGKPPVAPGETLEIISFLDAAERSSKGGGVPVKLLR